MEKNQISTQIKQLFAQPIWTLSGLVFCWSTFILASVTVVAFCTDMIFLSGTFPLGILQLIMILVTLRMQVIFLSSLHEQRALQLQIRSPERAETHFKWALRMTPGNPDLYCRWGEMLREQQRWADARHLFEQARTLAPAYDEPLVQLAYLNLRQGKWHEACRLFDLGYRLRRGVAWNDVPERVPNESPQEPHPRSLTTSFTKLEHDLQQLTFLLQGNYLTPSFSQLIGAYQKILNDCSKEEPGIRLTKAQHEQISLSYGRNIYISPVPAFPRSVINPELDLEKIQADYLSSQPSMVAIDKLFVPDAVDALLHFCQKSTIWHDDSRPGGYLGAYMDDGFNCELLYQIAHELKEALPKIIQGAPLKHMWAYKYDSKRPQGIDIHGDGAKINVNFWISPDEGNLNPETGGLKVYNVAAPDDWNFTDYNVDTEKTKAFLKQHQATYTRIPHRQNRAVIFDSRLFHASDEFHFKDNYLLRRINVTLLYG